MTSCNPRVLDSSQADRQQTGFTEASLTPRLMQVLEWDIDGIMSTIDYITIITVRGQGPEQS